MSTLASALKAFLWSGLLLSALAATAMGFAAGYPVFAFNAVFCSLLGVLLVLERRLPFEPRWVLPDGQTLPSVLHKRLSCVDSRFA